jgi:hypothetical protein
MYVQNFKSSKLANLFSYIIPKIKTSYELLNTMKVLLDYKQADPLTEMMVFLSHLEECDLNDDLIDNNKKGLAWGHYQYMGWDDLSVGHAKGYRKLKNCTWGSNFFLVEPTSQGNQAHFHIRKYDVIAVLFSLPTLPLMSHKPRKTALMFLMYSAGLLYYL